MDILIYVFELCVLAMRIFAEITGMTYKEINVLVFLVLQPALVVLFLLLWRYERKKGLSEYPF